jgi:outer membrane usher protein
MTRVSRTTMCVLCRPQRVKARVPCFSRKTVQGFGVDFAKAAADSDAKTNAKDNALESNADECVDLGVAVPGATVEFDFPEQKIVVTVPQKYMRNSARGYVPPEMWGQG